MFYPHQLGGYEIGHLLDAALINLQTQGRLGSAPIDRRRTF